MDNQFFMEFLHSMGWKVDIATHNGWNGNVNTSWRHKTEQGVTDVLFNSLRVKNHEFYVHFKNVVICHFHIAYFPQVSPSLIFFF